MDWLNISSFWKYSWYVVIGKIYAYNVAMNIQLNNSDTMDTATPMNSFVCYIFCMAHLTYLDEQRFFFGTSIKTSSIGFHEYVSFH